MGWMSWTLVYCQTDCDKYPHDCINEQLYMQMADRLAADGYLAVGYHSIHIDDCWLENSRSSDGKLVASRARFPSGMDALSAYMHVKGLILGNYLDIGTKTCAGYPGSWGYEQVDAQTFADWGIDYLKYDHCYLNATEFTQGFVAMKDALNKTNRPIVYSTHWTSHEDDIAGVNYTSVAVNTNLNRVYRDVAKSWTNVQMIIDYIVKVQDTLIPVQTPGYWNDPDMIVVGNPEISIDQAKSQMSIWAVWSAPLIMSNDLRNITPGHKEILQNKYVIAVDQDPLGVMGRMVNQTGDIMIFVKKMSPVINNNYSYAIVLYNRGNSSQPVSFVLNQLGLTNPSGYNFMDLWAGQIVGTFKPTDTYSTTVNSTGVSFIKGTVLQ